MKTKILDQIRGSEQGMLQLLEELVNIDSGADALAGINAVAQRIGAFLEVLGFTVEYLETDGAPVQLLARKAQPGKKQVLFSWQRYLVTDIYHPILQQGNSLQPVLL